MLARGLDGDVARAAIDAAQFDNASDDAFVKELFSPSLRRAGDLRTAAALAAPQPLLLHNTGDAFQTAWIADVYRAANAAKNFRVEKQPAAVGEIAKWIGL